MALSAAYAACAQDAPTASSAPATPVAPTPYSSECQTGSTSIMNESPLPNVAAALEQRKTIKILTIGASASAGRGAVRGGYTALIRQILERAIRGLDVVMINRGVSGELAANAATRIKNEVALSEPDLVLWQVGTNDALAYVPVEDIEATVLETVQWLKEHKVDVILVGLQYADSMVGDPHYVAVRDMLRRLAARENVIVVRRAEAMQIIKQAKHDTALDPDQFERTQAGYSCLAQYVARAIALGVFGKGLRPPEPRPQQAPR